MTASFGSFSFKDVENLDRDVTKIQTNIVGEKWPVTIDRNEYIFRIGCAGENIKVSIEDIETLKKAME